MKYHNNMGHPAKADFIRLLKRFRARPDITQYVDRESACEIC